MQKAVFLTTRLIRSSSEKYGCMYDITHFLFNFIGCREEVIAYYSQLTEEAARREQKALWRVQRGRLDLARTEFLLQQERQWAADLERAKKDPVSLINYFCTQNKIFFNLRWF